MAPLCLFVLVVFMGLFAWPKGYHGVHYIQQQNTQYPKNEGLWSEITSFNIFDDMLCENLPWRGFCRTLDLSGATLVRLQSDRGTEGLSEEFDLKKVDHYRRTVGLDLAGRSLRFANLGHAYLPAARLANVDLRGANLFKAKLRGAGLSGADLRGADLSEADLRGAGLSGADLRGAGLSAADLRGAGLSGADLRDADLSWADLRGANLSHAMLHNVDLEEAKLQGANLRGAQLQCAHLSWAKLHGVDLGVAKLHGADLIGAELHGANLMWAQMNGANLSGAELLGVNLTEADLRGAVLHGTSFLGVEGEPKTDKTTQVVNVLWGTANLERSDQCAEEVIRCHMDFRKIPYDLRLAWGTEIFLKDHLLASEKGNSAWPSWLPEAE